MSPEKQNLKLPDISEHLGVKEIKAVIEKELAYKEAEDLKRSLKEQVIESLQYEHSIIKKNWRNLETKSQGIIAISSVFLAGVFGFIKDIKENILLFEKIFLILIVLSFSATICFSVMALKIRSTSSPPVGKFLNSLLHDLFEVKDSIEFKKRLPLFFNDQISYWEKSNTENLNANSLKAKYLLFSQMFLIGAVILISILIIVKVFR